MGVFFICLAQCESGGYVFPAMRVGKKACVVARASVSGLSDVGRTYAELNARWR